jgi:hypothetical protein
MAFREKPSLYNSEMSSEWQLFSLVLRSLGLPEQKFERFCSFQYDLYEDRCT